MPDTLHDVIAPHLAVLFCGINPGLLAATTGHHFAGRSNRFWRVLHLAGFTPEVLRAEEDRRLLEYRCGITSVVRRPTAGADELTRADFLSEAAGFTARVEHYAPRTVAFLGKVAYAALVGRHDVAWGLQAEAFGGSRAWVLPNPSGRNRAFSLEQLVEAYHALHQATRKR
ncbi:G/U mismatch-specific DNA glycosylase [Dyella sp. C11]|uniref:G/U mismatch-specific DNA glycosylase n=1 Tax=Dyella sp. C11 TaxID=2126991 RepID=UPI000D65AE20|nr:G/U mismatch-specific DNA glycosylase [Dyella sp. C11]